MADQERLGHALQALAAEDKTLRFHTDQRTGQVVVAATGELHLEVIVDRLKREFGVEASLGKPQVAYKETLTVPADGHGRFVRQTAGRSQFGEAKIRVIPLSRGTGYQFEDDIKGGSIPKEYVRPIGEGIEETLRRGVLAGYPIIDVRVELYDAAYHDGDSSELAFKIAGSLAFQDAAKKAKPVLLEPVMCIEISVPEDNMDDVIGDLQSRRCEILSHEQRSGMQFIQARVPLSKILGYASDLRSRTQGRATCSMHFDRYEPRSPDDGPDDPMVRAQRRPVRPSQSSGVALPEPDLDDDEVA